MRLRFDLQLDLLPSASLWAIKWIVYSPPVVFPTGPSNISESFFPHQTNIRYNPFLTCRLLWVVLPTQKTKWSTAIGMHESKMKLNFFWKINTMIPLWIELFLYILNFQLKRYVTFIFYRLNFWTSDNMCKPQKQKKAFNLLLCFLSK